MEMWADIKLYAVSIYFFKMLTANSGSSAGWAFAVPSVGMIDSAYYKHLLHSITFFFLE